jgi:hypothetical protein
VVVRGIHPRLAWPPRLAYNLVELETDAGAEVLVVSPPVPASWQNRHLTIARDQIAHGPYEVITYRVSLNGAPPLSSRFWEGGSSRTHHAQVRRCTAVAFAHPCPRCRRLAPRDTSAGLCYPCRTPATPPYHRPCQRCGRETWCSTVRRTDGLCTACEPDLCHTCGTRLPAYNTDALCSTCHAELQRAVSWSQRHLAPRQDRVPE